MKRCIVYLFILPIVIGIHSSLFCQNAPIVVNYSYEPAVQHFVVPPGVSTITLTIAGAKGGGASGGNGASFTGVCHISENHVVSLVVGQRGDTSNGYLGKVGSGGGASWVYDSNIVLYTPMDNTGLLATAAGGGGEGALWDPYNDTLYYHRGGDGGVDLAANNTTSSLVGADTIGETGGNGGGGSFHAGGGAGWLSNGQGGECISGKDEANHFAIAAIANSYCDSNYLLYPGGIGGFGGGGEGGGYDMAGFSGFNGGGGGGYNGGGAGESDSGGGGGGGGSYLNGTLVGVATASDRGNGFVTISYIPPLSQVIAIYPNPNSGLFTINGVRQEQMIEIYNCLGQKVQTLQAINTFMQLDLSAYANGVYIVIVRNTDGSKVWQTKVVKMQ